jgi:hypothetical protein
MDSSNEIYMDTFNFNRKIFEAFVDFLIDIVFKEYFHDIKLLNIMRIWRNGSIFAKESLMLEFELII